MWALECGLLGSALGRKTMSHTPYDPILYHPHVWQDRKRLNCLEMRVAPLAEMVTAMREARGNTAFWIDYLKVTEESSVTRPSRLTRRLPQRWTTRVILGVSMT